MEDKNKFLLELERDIRRTLFFNLDLTTQQIANIEKVSKGTLISWRRCRNIQPNINLKEVKNFE